MNASVIPTVKERRKRVLALAKGGHSVESIARQTGLLMQMVREDLAEAPLTEILSLPELRLDKANTTAKKRQEKAQAQIAKDRRRIKFATPPDGKARIAAADETGTVHPQMLMEWEPGCNETIFKEGRHNRKIGGDVMVGPLKGAQILTLALEERATCPTTCALWRQCYGNNLHQTRRWKATPEFERAMFNEMFGRLQEGRDILVRLHILGDFYSTEYADLWAELLAYNENLHVFGFTAHKPGTEIGDYLAMMRECAHGRFSMRHSGTTGDWGTFTVDFPTEKRALGDAVVCPEQVSALPTPDGGKPTREGRHCGDCGFCWASSKPVVFVEH